MSWSPVIYRFTDGGEAEIFVRELGIRVHRPHVGAVFDIVAELVSRLGAIVVDPRDGKIVCGAEEYAHLSPSMRDDAVVIEMTGATLDSALTGAKRP